jgi:hypothetical protein
MTERPRVYTGLPVLERDGARRRRGVPRVAGAAPRQSESRRRVGPEAGPTSAFYSCVPTGLHGPTRIFRADLTLLTPALSRSQTSRELQGSYGPVLLTLSLLPVSRAAAAATCEEDEAEQDALPPGTAAACAPTAAVFAAVFAAADQRPRSGRARL